MIINIPLVLDSKNSHPTAKLILWNSNGRLGMRLSESDRDIGVDPAEMERAIKALDLPSGVV